MPLKRTTAAMAKRRLKKVNATAKKKIDRTLKKATIRSSKIIQKAVTKAYKTASSKKSLKGTEEVKRQSIFMQMHNGSRLGEGSFNVGLKELFYLADNKNRHKLVKAFPEFFGDSVPEFGIFPKKESLSGSSKKIKTLTGRDIKVRANHSKRTFTIVTSAAKYRTYPMSKEEFSSCTNNTGNDWHNFLRYNDGWYFTV